MIKLVTILKRGPALTRDAFAARWLTVHAPMAARFPGLRGYVLGFSIMPGDPPADGAAQLWFDDRAAAQRSYASDIGREGSADASSHLSRRDHLLASERWLSEPPASALPPFKLMVGVKRPDGRSRAAFIDAWARLDGAAAAAGARHLRVSVDDAGKLLNSGTAGTLDLRDGEAVFDGLLEAWFTSDRDLLGAAGRIADSDFAAALTADAAAVEIFALREHVIVPRADPPPRHREEQTA